MIDKQYILFDLDGTLTDPSLGITNSVIYALQKFGIHVPNREELYCFIGPPLSESFEVYYGFNPQQSQQAVEYYREYFKKQGMFENQVFDGVETFLNKLKNYEKQLLVATSKPEIFAKQILEHFELAQYFTCITGSELDGSRVDKAEVIACACKRCSITEMDQAIMIGDRMHDMIGAKKNNMQSVGVLFGFGDCSELEQAGADFIVQDLNELEDILL